jgi:hypothetical protein
MYWQMWNGQEEYIKKGCEPKAWNKFGIGTVWDCPVERGK